jgi:hypothetical protein
VTLFEQLCLLESSGVVISAALPAPGSDRLRPVGGDIAKLATAARDRSFPRVHSFIVASDQDLSGLKLVPDLRNNNLLREASPSSDFVIIRAESLKEVIELLQLRLEIREAEAEGLPVTSPGIARYVLDRWLPWLHRPLTDIGTLQAPAELADLNASLGSLQGRIKQEVREKTYIPLSAHPVPSSPFAHEGREDPFVAPIHQVMLRLIGRAQGGDSASAQIAAVNRRSRVVRNILRALDRSPEPLVLLGEPGSGKTMTLLYAALTIACRERGRVFPRVPLFVRLGDFHIEGPVGPEHVWHYVKRSAPEDLRPWLDGLESAGRLVLFFDGMDEMSRRRYTEHTEALSLFADRTYARTLFSCRITDFSPRFAHQRLVLKPFNYGQVKKFLRRYISSFPVLIDGLPWKLRRLAGHMVSGELSVEADNPFVLWLLCLFLQRRAAWPASRVELLLFYNEHNYSRKEEERQPNQPRFPPMDEAFREWGRFAYLITCRNRGPAIPVEEVAAGHDLNSIRETIRVGKLCGVLDESREEEQKKKETRARTGGPLHLVFFVHHRFQEFFAALHIHEAHPEIDWLDKFDAPRWQETLLNLILIGGGANAVGTFAGAIAGLTGACREKVEPVLEEKRKLEEKWMIEEIEGKKGKKETIFASLKLILLDTKKLLKERMKRREKEAILAKLEGILPDGQETELADRVELASRILRQVGPGAVREQLLPPFRTGVELLAEHGSPITQVKMMRACQSVPEIDFIETLRTPLHSPVRWVRNQALILLGGRKAADPVGADLATELGYDLANGMFPGRLPAYIRAAVASGSRGAWVSLLAGSLCWLVNFTLLLLAAVALYYGLWSLRSYTRPEPTPDEQQLKMRDLLPAWVPFDEGRWFPKPAQPPQQPETLDFRIFAILADPVCLTVFALVVLAAAGGTLRRWPYALWAGVIGSAFVIAFALPLLVAAWTGSQAKLNAWGLTFHASLFIIPWPAALVAAISHFSTLAVYVAVTAPLRRPRLAAPMGRTHTARRSGGHALSSFVATGWRDSSFTPILKVGVRLLGLTLIGYALIVPALVILLPVCQVLSDLSGLPFHPGVNALLVVVPAGLLGWLLVSLVRAVLQKKGTLVLGYLRALGFGLAIVLGFSLLIGSCLGVTSLLKPFFDWLETLPFWFDLLRVLIAIVLLALAVAYVVTLWRTLAYLAFLSTRKFPPGSFEPGYWKKLLEKASPNRQHYLLVQTDHQSLTLKPAGFLQVLKEVRPLITTEPALSTYWDMRDQLEQVLKQERQG